MRWFQGSIPEAVAASKSKKAVFVVFVEGKDDASQQVNQSLDSEEVSSRLETEKFVAIKLQSDSENYTFFAQIYHLVPVPSLFFIGTNGAPLEILGNPLPPADLASKIDSILLKANPQASSSANLIQAEQKSHSSTSSTQETKSEDKPSAKPESATENEVASSSSSDTPPVEKKPKVDLMQEDKVKRARELIELQNKKNMEEEERKERERELERRKMGKDVQKMKQQLQEKEVKEAYDVLKKEKAAEAAAREKILRQIAEDKLERKRKHEMHLQEKAAHQQKKAEAAQAKAQVAASADMSKARIQFKLPTGNSVANTFEATSTLSSLRTYVSQNVQLPFKQFSMSAFFPRRDFTSADDNKTLAELELVPSSVILILAVKTSNPASVIKSSDSVGIFSHFFWTLLAPVVSIYNFIMGYFNGRVGRSQDEEFEDEYDNEGARGARSGGSARPSFRRPNTQERRYGPPGRTSKIRARGNIHTLHSNDDDDDENNTWNGNSTQQM